jgi:3-methyladenine DNA glycosylase AlkD
MIFCLWDLPEREYQQAALDILEKVKKDLTTNDMSWLSTLIVKKSWRETIDVLSPRIMGYMFLTNHELVPLYANKWIENENIWLQRAPILYQLKYKEKTNEVRLFRYILRRASSDEFFVQKAIGWALREYAKTNPDNVKSFVSQHPLKPLSEREALKHFS